MDIVMIIGLVVLLILVFCLYLENRNINRALKYVEAELNRKASECRFDYERGQRRHIEEELKAIKNYFKIKSVQQTQHVIIVKDE